MIIQQIPKQIIIIGGGVSIQKGIDQNLWNRIKNKFTIGLNYSFNFFPSTIQMYVDQAYYEKEKENMKDLPLVIGKWYRGQEITDNTIVLPAHDSKYTRNLSTGVYKSSLVGIFALSIAIFLLEKGKIFLLGYDYKAQGKDSKNRPKTHFYQEKIEHRGIGKINYYNREEKGIERDFGVFRTETNCNIYNISPNSKIDIFPKLTYTEFFNKLDNVQYDQVFIRAWIKTKLNELEFIKKNTR